MTQRRASRANCSGRIDSAFANNSLSESTASTLVFPTASASRLTLAIGTRPDSTASRTAGTASITRAVFTWLCASRRDNPAASARTSAPPSPWRSRPATVAAAEVWNAEEIPTIDLEIPNASRNSSVVADPLLAMAIISFTAASARRAASISMSRVSHRGVIIVKYLKVI